ncbi:MAG: hypothetical protein EF807_06090, partial [Candidatus Methanolliviera hydrocarbonicum]
MKEDLKVELFGEKDTEELERLFKVVWKDASKYPSKWLEMRRYSKEKILAEMNEGYNYFGVRKD